MSYKIMPNLRGQLTKMFKHLYEELHAMGVAHETLQRISLRNALLRRFGSAEVIDAVLGEGVYRGIKQATGPFAQWRKLWDEAQEREARKEPVRIAVMESLKARILGCLAAGWSSLEIGREVQRSLGLSGWLQAS